MNIIFHVILIIIVLLLLYYAIFHLYQSNKRLNNVVNDMKLTGYNIYPTKGESHTINNDIYINTKLSDDQMKENIVHEITHLKTGSKHHDDNFINEYSSLIEDYN